MKLLTWALMTLLALAALTVGGGALLPQKFGVVRTLDVNATPDKVYLLLESPRRWAEWAPWSRRDPTLRSHHEGAAVGRGATWRWEGGSAGAGRLTLTAAAPGRGVAYELQHPAVGTTATGELRLAAQGAGSTRVTWTLAGDAGSHPLMRWIGVFADGMVGRDFEAGLEQLKVLAERP